jgi:hypothetical protein
MRRSFVTLALLGGLFFPIHLFGASDHSVPWADGRSRASDLAVSLVTFGIGDDIPSWFGHSAFLVRDSRLQVERVYNFGMFHFGPDMLAKFVRGRLEFWVGEASWPRTQRLYRSLGRDVRLQKLNLSLAKTKEVAQFLAWNVMPENRDYLYDHYRDNCSTRIRDIIDRAVDGQFRQAASTVSPLTLRDHTHRHTQRVAAVDWLLSFWMADAIDEPIEVWDDMFLPLELERQIEVLQYVDSSGVTRPMVAERTLVVKGVDKPLTPDVPASGWPGALLTGFFFGALGVFLARRSVIKPSRRSRVVFGLYHASVGLTLGVSGLGLAYLMVLSDHTITYGNENILLANPLTFLLLFLGVGMCSSRLGPRRWARRIWMVLGVTALAALCTKILPGFEQDNWLSLSFLLPINVLNAWAFYRYEIGVSDDAKHG